MVLVVFVVEEREHNLTLDVEDVLVTHPLDLCERVEVVFENRLSNFAETLQELGARFRQKGNIEK